MNSTKNWLLLMAFICIVALFIDGSLGLTAEKAPLAVEPSLAAETPLAAEPPPTQEPSPTQETLLAEEAPLATKTLTGGETLPTPAIATTPTLTGDAINHFLNTFVPPAMANQHVPGVLFVAVKNGEILTMRGFGFSNLEAGSHIDPTTTAFRVGSISKVFTGMAVMQLVEHGLLDLDKDVNAYIKGFSIPATYPEPITLRHLLTHTAGFDDRNLGMSEFGVNDYPQLGTYLAAEMPPRIRPPGQLIQYNNHGVALAGYIVECVSGMPFAQYVQRNIMAPLGMKHSSFELTPKIKSWLASSYNWQKGKYVQVPYVHINPTPAGSLITTAADMAKFMIAILAGGELDQVRVLEAQYVNTMLTQQFTHHPALPGIGFTWWINPKNGYKVFSHGGDIWQFSTQLLLIPEENFGLFISGNSSGAAAFNEELVAEFFATFFPQTVVQNDATDTKPKEWSPAPRTLTGLYRTIRYPKTTADKVMSLLTQFHLTANKDGSLTLASPAAYGRPPTKWVPTGSGVYRDTASDDVMAFVQPNVILTNSHTQHMYIGAWAFEKVPFYETLSFTMVLLVLIALVFIWAMLAWIFGRKVSGLAASLGLVNLVSIVGIASSLLTIPPWILTTSLPPIALLALALPLVGIALALALLWQTTRHMTATRKWDHWSFCRRITRRGFTAKILPWLCIAADAIFVWFLYTWNLLGWKL